MTTLAVFAELRPRVDRVLADFLAHQHDRLVALVGAALPAGSASGGGAPAAYTAVELVRETLTTFLGGGKRLRPAFAYWGHQGAGGEDSQQLVRALTALELVQASALIHDDVMDDSDTRRGAPSVHRRFATHHEAAGWHGAPADFGLAAAILLGDLCLVWSDELLHSSGLPSAALARARPVFDEMRTEVTLGQYLDVLTQATGDTTVDASVMVARLKSAKYTVERPLLFGASLAGASPELSAAYSAYGLSIGEAFQLRDDVLGVFGDPAHTGKPAGDDLRAGKRTYLVAAAFEGADPATRTQLTAGLGDPKLDDAGVRELRKIIIDTGALARTEQRISELTTAAVAALADAPLPAAAAEALTALATAATTRTR